MFFHFFLGKLLFHSRCGEVDCGDISNVTKRKSHVNLWM